MKLHLHLFHFLFVCFLILCSFLRLFFIAESFFVVICRDNPTFLACMLCSVMAIMKSYPCLGDAAVPLALLALWMHIFPCKYTFSIVQLFVQIVTGSFLLLKSKANQRFQRSNMMLPFKLKLLNGMFAHCFLLLYVFGPLLEGREFSKAQIITHSEQHVLSTWNVKTACTRKHEEERSHQFNISEQRSNVSSFTCRYLCT